jgi:hypothetical protein
MVAFEHPTLPLFSWNAPITGQAQAKVKPIPQPGCVRIGQAAARAGGYHAASL